MHLSICRCFVQSLSRVWLFVTPWTAEHHASLPFTVSWSFLKLMSIESVMPSNYLNLCCSILLLSIFPSSVFSNESALLIRSPKYPLLESSPLPSVFPTIRVFSSESALCIRWPKYWSFSFSISPFEEYWGFISFRINWFDLPCCPRDSPESSPSPQFKDINSLYLKKGGEKYPFQTYNLYQAVL